MNLKFGYFNFVILLFGCSISNNDSKDHEQNVFLGYDLGAPSQETILSRELVEISGLAYLDDNKLVAIQDENGILFTVNLKSGEIESRIIFGKNKDYEGVEIAGNQCYVVTSKGDIHTFDLLQDSPEVKKIKTPLSSKNDVEGLGYDATNHQLLLGCKGSPDTENHSLKGKAIYALSLEDGTFELKYELSTNEVGSILNLENSKSFRFSPSAVAVHPLTDDIYVLSHQNRMIIALGNGGEIKAVSKLSRAIFRQPEGICFSPEGILFISNEGRGHHANILRFDYNPTLKKGSESK